MKTPNESQESRNSSKLKLGNRNYHRRLYFLEARATKNIEQNPNRNSSTEGQFFKQNNTNSSYEVSQIPKKHSQTDSRRYRNSSEIDAHRKSNQITDKQKFQRQSKANQFVISKKQAPVPIHLCDLLKSKEKTKTVKNQTTMLETDMDPTINGEKFSAEDAHYQMVEYQQQSKRKVKD